MNAILKKSGLALAPSVTAHGASADQARFPQDVRTTGRLVADKVPWSGLRVWSLKLHVGVTWYCNHQMQCLEWTKREISDLIATKSEYQVLALTIYLQM
jgi:hypothetical protein